MKIKIVSLIFIFLLLPIGNLWAKEKSKTFSVPIEKVFDAAVQVAKAKYTIQAVDRQEHILVFHTGMGAFTYGMELTVSFNSESSGKTIVTARPAKRGAQLFAWGQGGKIADKFFKRLKAQLEEGTQ